MSRTRLLCIALCGLPTVAHGAIQAATQTTPSDSAAAKDSSRQTRARQAEELLRELRRRRPAPDVIPPASSAAHATEPPPRRLLPEGTAAIAETGSLRRAGDWWVLQIESRPEDPPIKLLANSTLEAMVRMAGAAATSLRFELSGEWTVFQGENYLLVRSVGRTRPSENRASSPRNPDTAVVSNDTRPHGARVPADSVDRDPVAWDADPEQVLARLQDLDPQTPPQTPSAESFHTGGQPRQPADRFLEGSMVIGRRGRLLAEPRGWILAFDSDRAGAAESHLRLLPNRALEFMVDAAKGDPSGPAFVVSGEIMEYDGQSFLLARAVVKTLPAGNLRR